MGKEGEMITALPLLILASPLILAAFFAKQIVNP